MNHETYIRLDIEDKIDLARRVAEAVTYSYEAGEYPPETADDVAWFMSGDGGLLNALRLVDDLGRMLPQ